MGFLFVLIICYWLIKLAIKQAREVKEINEKEAEKEAQEKKFLDEVENKVEKFRSGFDVVSKGLNGKELINNNISIDSILSSLSTQNPDSINIEICNNSTIEYNRTKDYVEENTNQEKVYNFKSQIEELDYKFGGSHINRIKEYYNKEILSDKIKYIVNNINNLDDSKYKALEKYKNHENYKHIEERINNFFENKKIIHNIISKDNDVYNIVNEYLDFVNCIEKIVENRKEYLHKEYDIANLGYSGEVRVNNELKKYEEFTVFESKTFNLSKIDFIDENYKIECDNIIISQHGVFVLETKNVGENSITYDDYGNQFNKYKLHIEKEGRWVRRYNNGSFEVWENNPIIQNRDHILKLKKILEYHLKEDIDITGIIVIANDEVEIINESFNATVCRVSNIYETIKSFPKDISLTKQKINLIKDIINKYNTKEHTSQKYKTINVAKEIENIDVVIKSDFIKERKLYIDHLYRLIRDYNLDISLVELQYQLDKNYANKENYYDYKNDTHLTTIKTKSGQTYFGDVITFSDCSSYKHGTGQLTWPDGKVYKGEFRYNVICGEGTFDDGDGFTYEGNFIEGSPNGKGKATYQNGNVYEGCFINGEPNGKGKAIYKNGNVHEGCFINGEPNGIGILTYDNGDICSGDFTNGDLEGEGTYIWKSSGNIYEGEFSGTKFNGKGKITMENGDVYEGYFINGEPNGKGKLTCSNGDIYSGQFPEFTYQG